VIGLRDRDRLHARTAVPGWLMHGRLRGECGRKRCGVCVVAVQVCDQPSHGAGQWGGHFRQSHFRHPRAEGGEHLRGIIERVDYDALALLLEFDTCPAEPSDPH
jgi:hypothetical protein